MTTVGTSPLFEPLMVGGLELPNRIVMAPMTRNMATEDYCPTEQAAAYYARRAETGLILTEATVVTPEGRGHSNTPGVYTEAQVDAWRRVADAVHEAGGRIFMQLWHVGRVTHPELTGGAAPVSASAVRLEGTIARARHLEYAEPRAMTQDDIGRVVDAFARGASNAIAAGCDGVEIHGANGYLLDQFLHHHTNRRDDGYGCSPENMSRFAIEVTDAVIDAVGGERTGIRLSPGAYFNMEGDPRDAAVFEALLRELNRRDLAYVHTGIFDDSMRFDELGGRTSTEFLREHYAGVLMACGSYSPESAARAIAESRFDLIAIGRPLIANPDYVHRVRRGEDLVAYDADMLTDLH